MNILGGCIKEARKNFDVVVYCLKVTEHTMLKLGEESSTREMRALPELGRDQDQRYKDPEAGEPEDITHKAPRAALGTQPLAFHSSWRVLGTMGPLRGMGS